MRTLHLGLRVADLETSLAFYTDLGYEVVGNVEGTKLGDLTMLKLPGDPFVTIELVSGSPEPDTGLNHLVIQTDALGDPGEMRTEWVTDPDGNRIELVQWPPGHPEGMTGDDFA